MISSFIFFTRNDVLAFGATTRRMHQLPKLVMLDRDGVINEDVGASGVLDCSEFILTPNASHAIGTLKRLGCSVVVITNQSCGTNILDTT